MSSRLKPATRIVQFEAAPGDPFRPAATPIYQTATFEQESALSAGPYDYSRSGNPTRTVLETHLASLENAHRALAFSSGLAALSAVLRLCGAGDHILAGDDLYGGTHRLLSRVLARQGLAVTYADLTDLAAVERALTPKTRLVLFETPTNPLQRIVDIAAVSRLARANGSLVAVDASFLSPYLQRPLEHGADIAIHSATKLLSGHSDLTAGTVAVRDGRLAEDLAFIQNAEGAALSPFESWLLLRGIKTLAIRLDRQQANAQRLATFLARHPGVSRLSYPGLPGHPGRETHFRQASGAGVVISFGTGSIQTARIVAEETRLFSIAVSFGGVHSAISLPCRMSHASLPKGWELPEDLVRISVGIEDAEDLADDLGKALDRADAATSQIGTSKLLTSAASGIY
jgi:cystathionine beta-lyase